MKTGYIPSLDGIRAISVLLVLFSHAGLGHILPGGFGVTIFFFLSGFLITTLLNKEYVQTKSINYPNFFARRFFRLFPPLFFCLLITYLLAAFDIVKGGYSLTGLAAQVFYLANYHSVLDWPGATPDGLNILWSLAVEEHFYLLFPLLLLLLMKKMTNKTTVILLSIFCIFVLSWRLYLVIIEHVSQVRTYYSTDTRIDSILWGCIFALSSYNPIYLKQKTKVSIKDILILTISTIILLFTLTYRNEIFRETFRYTLQGLVLAPFFYYSIVFSKSILFSWLNTQILKKLGVYSYAIYLIHLVIINVFKQTYLGQSIPSLIFITLVLSVLFALFIDKYVDNYFRVLRAKFR